MGGGSIAVPIASKLRRGRGTGVPGIFLLDEHTSDPDANFGQIMCGMAGTPTRGVYWVLKVGLWLRQWIGWLKSAPTPNETASSAKLVLPKHLVTNKESLTSPLFLTSVSLSDRTYYFGDRLGSP